ncbi:MAG: pentapeptide repeat-containing protein [Legionella sp.]|uniref:pentapeptide repeat-containing protein n=1 Tax=Legionella sp. TaxID=459 RepID=UPI00283B5357|nr:pentapeptide repeat-containing protein [Legionella sp.]
MTIEIKNRFSAKTLFTSDTATDLVGALEEAVKAKMNLRGANLSSADLCSANLSNADLYGADLCSANLSNADLYGADLRGANLRAAPTPETREPSEGLLAAVDQIIDDMQDGLCVCQTAKDWLIKERNAIDFPTAPARSVYYDYKKGM